MLLDLLTLAVEAVDTLRPLLDDRFQVVDVTWDGGGDRAMAPFVHASLTGGQYLDAPAHERVSSPFEGATRATTGLVDRCVSCGEPWPCTTTIEATS